MAILRHLFAGVPLLLILLSSTIADSGPEASRSRRSSDEEFNFFDGPGPDTLGQEQGCAATQWSDWSNCSTRCNKGLQRRERQFPSAEDPAICETKEEQQFCNERKRCKPCMVCRGIFTHESGPRIYRIRTNETQAAADVVLVVDESGSMRGEHVWLTRMVNSLDNYLRQTLNIGNHSSKRNHFALVGFGSSNYKSFKNANNEDFFEASDFDAARMQLRKDGQREDGYLGMWYALDTTDVPIQRQVKGRRSNDPRVALTVILVTDETRVGRAGDPDELPYNVMKEFLLQKGATPNFVLNQSFNLVDGDVNEQVIGVDFRNQSYIPDGSGGFLLRGNVTLGRRERDTDVHYTRLALDPDLGGAAWDINILRNGGENLVRSFTRALTFAKAREILATISQCEVCSCDGVDGRLKCVRMDDQKTCCHKAGGQYNDRYSYCPQPRAQ